MGLFEEVVGQTGSGHITVTEAGVRLPVRRARLVRLENWPLLGDLATANEADALYGFYDQYLHWLNAGGNTDNLIVPEMELSNVCLRSKPDETVEIFYTWTL